MATPQLSIGMAHFDDFDGAYFTIQSLILHHQVIDCEIVVIDNSPEIAEVANSIKALLHNVSGKICGAKYVAFPGAVGTSQSRNEIFKQASFDHVLCLDCHVLLANDAIAALQRYFGSHPDSSDLITGPMSYDHHQDVVTHLSDQWRGHMWGTWGQAWRCECDALFETYEIPDEAGQASRCGFRTLAMNPQSLIHCNGCFRALPVLEWPGHETMLEKIGCWRPGRNKAEKAFDIPGMGLGLFACRKDAWLGFNPNFSGFGGEEMYIHEKFRRAGHRCLNLPALGWLHRFGRPGHKGGAPYPLRLEDRVRNYVIGLTEIGIPLDRAHEHFTKNGLSEQAWQEIVAMKDYPPPVRPPQPSPILPAAGQGSELERGPRILCVCPTYGRPPHLLANTLACYEQQDYAGPKHLFIYDDLGNVKSAKMSNGTLHCSTVREPSLPEKYDTMLRVADLSKYDIVVVWEDDDVYLPWHLSAIAECWQKTKARWFHPREVWSTYGGSAHKEGADGRFHASLAINTELLDEIGGWVGCQEPGHVGRGDFDQRVIAKCREIGGEPGCYDENPKGPSYVFRWQDTGAVHGQGLMAGADEEQWWNRSVPQHSENVAAEPCLDEAAQRTIAEIGQHMAVVA